MSSIENFKKAHQELGGMEGTYSNDKDDPGGETLYGWARKMEPDIPFWPKVDAYKNKYGGVTKECIAAILADEEIKQISENCYKKKYWDHWGCDDLPYSLALELFEQSINLGIGGCGINLQNVLNAMNYTTKDGIRGYGKDLKVDGDFGNNSKNRFKQLLDDGYADVVQFGLNCEQGASYRLKAEKTEIKRKYYKGWLRNRCSAIFKK